MTIDPARFGIDIRLLGDLQRQSQRELGADLRTVIRPASSAVDLEPVSGVENLQQALLLRLLTPTGELAALGHPDYGSRLHELIGEPNTQTNRNRARLFALRALLAEPRIEEVRSLAVTTRRDRPNRIDIEARLAVLDEDTDLNLVFPFDYDGGAP
ncbi:MAG TPA: GPW/gp25 family protein [Nitriliruptorales bacterium]|nr:GPW/gp25 family protein [Nitriliruptorales bacterium]